MTKYSEVRAIALTVSQMLSLNLALHDAIAHNEAHDYPQHAGECKALLKAIREQTDAWIDAADKECRDEK